MKPSFQSPLYYCSLFKSGLNQCSFRFIQEFKNEDRLPQNGDFNGIRPSIFENVTRTAGFSSGHVGNTGTDHHAMKK